VAVLWVVLLSWTLYYLRVRSGCGCSLGCPVKLDALLPTGPVGMWLFYDLFCWVVRFITDGSGRDVVVLWVVLLSWTHYYWWLRSGHGCSPLCPVKLDALSPTGPVGTWLFSICLLRWMRYHLWNRISADLCSANIFLKFRWLDRFVHGHPL